MRNFACTSLARNSNDDDAKKENSMEKYFDSLLKESTDRSTPRRSAWEGSYWRGQSAAGRGYSFARKENDAIFPYGLSENETWAGKVVTTTRDATTGINDINPALRRLQAMTREINVARISALQKFYEKPKNTRKRIRMTRRNNAFKRQLQKMLFTVQKATERGF
ncbi:hypothetical protein CANCADRAFT_44653 [Tortispora caseinolytica NRRL Y-17796]|uniref:Ribosomal protein S21 n=1 Tax=Tortispora caseinolytica NRRL Y-17796 TaxID=767744 RepID=A0A1E4TGZ0_9ASCO|nr:hypothetical protein CANCADRAFT_44653 [Tortispora caseinolytica NRRL Y-17796]